MALKTISAFKAALSGGGVRPNLFEVRMNASNLTQYMGGIPQEELEFMCKAANLPAQNVASIDVPFRGRQFKVAGDRTIDNWTITVINDENFGIRNAFEKWSQSIISNEANQGQVNPEFYMTTAEVYQYGRASVGDTGTGQSILKRYKFVDIFPVTVGDIALSYESGDTIEEFDVEFAVNNIELIGLGPLAAKASTALGTSATGTTEE